MRFSIFVEKYFWLFLISGIVLGLWNPLPFVMPHFVPKLLLGMMLFLVFLKIDAIHILENIKNFRLMIWITAVYMFIIPLGFYFSFSIFNPELALGILLLTAMPAGVSSPALTDIVRGNAALSMSLALVSQIIAPFTVPLLFWFIDVRGIEIDKVLLFKDIALLVFIPMIISQVVKRLFPAVVRRTHHLLTSANVFVLFAFVYVALASQRDVILDNPVNLVWKVIILYVVFILLHIIGYLACPGGNRGNRIAVAVGAAYMNNGMAIVLAASYFSPEILVLMVLSELPWNTLPGLFRKMVEKKLF